MPTPPDPPDGPPPEAARPVTVASVQALAAPIPLPADPFATPAPGEPQRLRDEGIIGEGGVARVHRVFDGTLLRHVAMKVLSATAAAGPEVSRRFVEEAQITGQLDHPNIVPVHAVGAFPDGRLFFTMKLVEGRTLTDLLSDEIDFTDPRRRDLERVIKVLVKVCEAVAFAHSRGVLHLDLKPDNVMVGHFGQVYVMDWGIAHLMPGEPDEAGVRTTRQRAAEREGLVSGTLAYMSPEQAMGEPARFGPHTDVFSLGAILYEVLTGEPPYSGDDLARIFHAAARGDVPPATAKARARGLPRALVRIAETALARDPADRYPTAEAMAADLERFMHGGAWYSVTDVPAGTVVVREGDRANAAYVVSKGTCEVYTERDGKRVPLQTVGRGGVFGEVAVLTDGRRTASVRALTDATLLVVTRATLQAELDDHGRIGIFLKALADRFSAQSQQLADARRRGDAQRTLARLLDLLAFEGRRVGDTLELSWLKVVGDAGVHEGELLDLVQVSPRLTLDESRGVLVLTRGG